MTKAEADPLIDKEMLEGMAAAYLGDRSRTTPLASPYYADLSGLPPLLVQVGTAEVLLDDSLRLAEKAKESGVDVTLEVWDDMPHVWQASRRFFPRPGRPSKAAGSSSRSTLAELEAVRRRVPSTGVQFRRVMRSCCPGSTVLPPAK